MSEFRYDDANPEHRFMLAILFGELANERTLQLTAADLRAIFHWIVKNTGRATELQQSIKNDELPN